MRPKPSIDEVADKITAALIARLSPEEQRVALVSWNAIGAAVAHRIEARCEIINRRASEIN